MDSGVLRAVLLDLLEPLGVDTPLRQSGRDMLLTCNIKGTFKKSLNHYVEFRIQILKCVKESYCKYRVCMLRKGIVTSM